MQTAWRPTPAGLAGELARAVRAALTYDEVGLSARAAPPGWTLLEQRSPLGEGDLVAQREAEALLGWDLHREARMVLATDSPQVAVGATVVDAALLGPLAVLAPCRVVALVEQPGRRGFRYGSLPGHPLVGEEQFTVERDGALVLLRIRSVSLPVGPAALAPALARAGQRHVNRRYAAAARRLAAAAVHR